MPEAAAWYGAGRLTRGPQGRLIPLPAWFTFMETRLRLGLIFALLVWGLAAPALAAGPGDRCAAMIAVLEAAGEGEAGMAAVIEVVRNRVADPRFPNDACAVVVQERQFQPVSEWPALRRALLQPASFDPHAMMRAGPGRRSLERALELARQQPAGRTGGALYFVNPLAMDPRHCSWFATLKRTATIRNHVFMRHYGQGERRGEPALDCADPSIGSLFRQGPSLARRYAQGLFHPEGPRTATRTPTPAEREAWRRVGGLEARARELRQHFKPGWIALD